MTDYLDSYDSFDSSSVDQRDYHSFGLVTADPVRQVQIRMVFIFAVAAMIAVALSLLALPVQIGTGAGAAIYSEAVDAPASDIQVFETNSPLVTETNIVAVAPAAAGGGIADFFTPEVQYWEPQIVQWASQHSLDPNAVATIMQIESCGDPRAVSVAGARGLFQVMPFHFSSSEDMLDPDTNARRGLDFLNEQLRYTGGDIFLSFAGYNGGYAASGGSYDNWANETQRYYQWAKGIYEDASSGAASSETLNAWLDAGGRPGCARAAGNLGI